MSDQAIHNHPAIKSDPRVQPAYERTLRSYDSSGYSIY
jgi:hypothetical protein